MLKEIFEQVLTSEAPRVTSSEFKIRPSILGSKCLREIFYSATGVEPDNPFPLDAKRRMKLGDAVHSMLEDVFSKAGIVIKYRNPDGSIPKDQDGEDDYEFPISCPELFIKRGKIDGVLVINQELWLVEYKSINERGFRELHGPKPDHLIQGVSYLYLFNKSLAEGAYTHIQEVSTFPKAKGIVFLYVCKDNTDMLEFPVLNADEKFAEIVNKIFTIKQHADEGTLPPCTPSYGKICSCQWKIKSKNNQIK